MNNNLPNQKPQSTCDNCNSDEQLILHNIIKAPKSPPQKLCNSCVLSHFQKSFCSQCFEPYDANALSPPPTTTAVSAVATAAVNNRLLNCMRCDNWSHFGCPRANVPKSPYICPRCMSPNYKFFDFSKKNSSAIDKEVAKQFLGAARMAAVTVAKAAGAARVEVERKAKEAALARKRASEAIDHVVAVAAKVECVRRKEVVKEAVMVTASGAKAMNYVPVRLEGSNVGDPEVKNGGNSTNGAVVTVPVPAVPVVMPRQQCDDKTGTGVSNGVNAEKTESKMP